MINKQAIQLQTSTLLVCMYGVIQSTHSSHHYMYMLPLFNVTALGQPEMRVFPLVAYQNIPRSLARGAQGLE